MLKDILMGLLRHGLTIAGTAAVARGYTDESTATAIAGGVVAAASVAWSVVDKKKRA